MIRTIFFSFITAVFFLGVLTFAFAQEATPFVPSPTPEPVEYALPYPGMLPDHPLYFLKALRDKILVLLISDPVRKVEFQLLLADKHLNMGIFLVNKDKQELAAKTIEQGVKHMKLASELLFEISAEESAQIGNLKDRLERAMMKHQQVMEELSSKVGGEYKGKLEKYKNEIVKISENYSRRK